MGGSKPTPPTIIMPEESNPQAFQTIIPQKSYKDLAESMGRTEKEYNRLVDQRYDTVGTAAEMGARNRGGETVGKVDINGFAISIGIVNLEIRC